MNDPKLFDAFNVPRPPRELAEDIAAALRVWDRSYKDAVRIGDDLNRLSRETTERTWGSLSPLLPPPAPWCDETAKEVFQILKIWGLSHRDMVAFVGRFRAVLDEKGPKGWNDWKPDLRPNYAIPGVSSPK